jgi:hypothetical protein
MSTGKNNPPTGKLIILQDRILKKKKDKMSKDCSYCLQEKEKCLPCGEADCKQFICRGCANSFPEIDYWLSIDPRCCYLNKDGKRCERLLCQDCAQICHECANCDVVETFCSEHAPKYRIIDCENENCMQAWYICPKHPSEKDQCGRGCNRSIPDY